MMFEGEQWLLQEYGVMNGLREEIVITITRCFGYGHHMEAKNEHGNLFTRRFGTRWEGGGKEWNAIRQVGVKDENTKSNLDQQARGDQEIENLRIAFNGLRNPQTATVPLRAFAAPGSW